VAPAGEVAALPPGAVRMGSWQLSRDQGALSSDPSDEEPDIIIGHTGGSLNVLSAICTRQGPQLGHPSAGRLQCPSHGGLHNPYARAGGGGPPSAPLPPRRAFEHGRKIYAMSP
jgi:Rieske Fe-S protein